ncbi:hypothetical protein ADT71_14885 [Novosphingobium sp. ST904]|nr:hypothetical protein ADT71_14885 [Novosphingobium sp. ST904]
MSGGGRAARRSPGSREFPRFAGPRKGTPATKMRRQRSKVLQIPPYLDTLCPRPNAPEINRKEQRMPRKRNIAPRWLMPLLLAGSMVAAGLAATLVSSFQ